MDNEYVVKEGDTLYGISKQFGVSVNDLMDANDMKNDVVVLGSTMVIPEEKPITYTVKAGDNLYNIAKDFGVSVSDKRYNTTVTAIKELNNIAGNELSVGDVIKVPTVLVDDVSLIGEGTYKEYTVRPGDNLYTIAKSFGVSVDDIKNINNLTSNSLTVGEVLMIGEYIPNPLLGLSCYKDSNTITYIVKKGDNLYDIAKEYNTSVSAIKEINNLTSNDLSVGQILKIEEVK